MKKKFAIVLALFLIAVVCSAGCIDPETPVDPVDPVVPVDPVTPVDPVDPVVPVEEYSVMFMLNYGDAGAYTAETVKAGETVSKPATPTRSGYTFKGWFTAAEGGAEYDFTQAVNADVTLYAQWKKKSSSSSSGSSHSHVYNIGGQKGSQYGLFCSCGAFKSTGTVDNAIEQAPAGATIDLTDTTSTEPISVGNNDVVIEIGENTAVKLDYAEDTPIQIKADNPANVEVTITDTDAGTQKKVYFEDAPVGGLLVPSVAVDTANNVGDAYTASGLADLAEFINSGSSSIFDAPVDAAPTEHVQDGWNVLFYEPAPTALGDEPEVESQSATEPKSWTITLKGDIDLMGKPWTPIGTTENPFTGTFDGQGYTIKGLTNKEDATSFGLFEKVSGTVVIKNFDLYVDAVASENVKSEGWAGVVGMSNGKQCDLTLENIKVYGTLTADDKVAGVIAQAPTYADNGSELTVRNCKNYAAVTGTRAAGICCSINNYNDYANTFENCVNHGTITAREGKYQTAAGILCKNEAGTLFTNCENKGELEASIAYNIATKLVITFDPTTYRAGAARANPAADKYYYTMSNPDVESMYSLFKGEPYSADTAVDWEEVVRTSNSIDLTGLGAGVWYDTENAADYLVTVTTKKATPNGEEQKYYETLKAFKTLDEALSHSLDGAEVTLKANQEMNAVLTSGVIGATGIFKTLDLNDHTLTMIGNITVNGNGLTIKNGTITHNAVGDELFVLTGAGAAGVVTFENVTLNAEGKCIAKIGASYAGVLNIDEKSNISGYIDLTGNSATELTINENTYSQTDGRYVVITNNVVTRTSSL